MIRDEQYKKFSFFLNDINNKIPYYGEIIPSNCNSYEQIYREFPCISKSEIINNYKDCINSEIVTSSENCLSRIIDTTDLSYNHDKILTINGAIYKIETTSGTTGKPLPVIKSEITKIVESRYLLKCRKRIEKKACIKNGFLLIHSNDRYINELNLRDSHEIFKDYDKLFSYYFNSENKIWFFSTALILRRAMSYLEMHPDLAEKFKKKVPSFWETTSQKVDVNEKKQYDSIASIRYVNNYGCREVWNIAYECSEGNLHLNTDYLIVDVIDNNGQIIFEDGTEGEVIVTSLINKSTPFIKYRTGDYGCITRKHNCKCGLKSPILHLCNGRRFEKIKYTNKYGNDVFKRVLRGIYFHDLIREYEDIKIIQNDRTFNVYVNGILTDEFKKAFIRHSTIILQDQQFKYNFIQADKLDFLNMRFKDKDFIFKCIA